METSLFLFDKNCIYNVQQGVLKQKHESLHMYYTSLLNWKRTSFLIMNFKGAPLIADLFVHTWRGGGTSCWELLGPASLPGPAVALCAHQDFSPCFLFSDSSHTDRLSFQCRPTHPLLLPDDVARVNSHCVLPQVPGVSTPAHASGCYKGAVRKIPESKRTLFLRPCSL